MILVVCGSRSIRDRGTVELALDSFYRCHRLNEDEMSIMHGGAPGVDSLVDSIVPDAVVERPDYDKYPSKQAPIERNKVMAEKGDALLAIWDGESSGTMSAVKFAFEEKLSPVMVWTTK